MSGWFAAAPSTLLAVVVSTLAIYAVLVVLVRTVGLRSFSKMTSVDFAITITTGAVLASTLLNQSPPLAQGVVALCTLFALQAAVAWGRRHGFSVVVDNEPVVLMAGSRMLRDNLRRTRVTENDVWAKLREANVLDPAEVRAVVLESTGDISVLHGDVGGCDLHPCLLRGVGDADALDLGDDDYDG